MARLDVVATAAREEWLLQQYRPRSVEWLAGQIGQRPAMDFVANLKRKKGWYVWNEWERTTSVRDAMRAAERRGEL